MVPSSHASLPRPHTPLQTASRLIHPFCRAHWCAEHSTDKQKDTSTDHATPSVAKDMHVMQFRKQSCKNKYVIRVPEICHWTHTFNGPFPGLPGWAGTRKVKPIWILLNQETVGDSGISWAICKSAPRSRLEVCGNRFFRTNSLPFQWLHSHSNPIPIPVWNLNPIPIFSHPAIPESFPFPPGNSNETSCYAQKVGCNKF